MLHMLFLTVYHLVRILREVNFSQCLFLAAVVQTALSVVFVSLIVRYNIEI